MNKVPTDEDDDFITETSVLLWLDGRRTTDDESERRSASDDGRPSLHDTGNQRALICSAQRRTIGDRGQRSDSPALHQSHHRSGEGGVEYQERRRSNDYIARLTAEVVVAWRPAADLSR